MISQVLLVDDDPYIRESVSQTLELEGYEVEARETAEQGLNLLTSDWCGVLVTDINLPGMNGLALLNSVQKIDTDIPVILITGHGDVAMAVNAMRDGAYDFIEKPFSAELLIDVVHRASEKRALTLENRELKAELSTHNSAGPRLIGNTPQITQLRALVRAVADTPADILIHAETGSGKDLLARYIHENSVRRGGNFVAINCGAVPENLIESELFGHEAGAFTGAKSQRIGKFEYAGGGTLFLDEIESMPLSLQVKLLRVLEERAIERLGSNKVLPVDLRIIAASKVSLRDMVDEGRFREDLYYRLDVVKVVIPPLRERPEDIPLLFKHFSLVAASQYRREVVPLPLERMHELMLHNWPGNVRELRNLAERYVLLGEAFSFDAPVSSIESSKAQSSLPQQLENFERMLIHNELERHAGSIKETLNALGVPRKTLYDKMRKYALDKTDYK